jgi:hypothetical protein
MAFCISASKIWLESTEKKKAIVAKGKMGSPRTKVARSASFPKTKSSKTNASELNTSFIYTQS